MQTVYIKKLDGTEEEFKPEKLKASLSKAGADEHVADSIVKSIVHQISTNEIFEPTASEIYKRAFHELKDRSRPAAARYSLRRSVMGFGPTGFPFEEYISELFSAKGFSTLTDQTVLGTCVPHEVDVIAWNTETLLFAEVKYHNEAVGKTDLKVSLYVKARYDDLKDTLFDYGNIKRHINEGWLITNTKFTETALKYGICNNIKMLSWNYPTIGNLHDLIEETKLHPITTLTTITESEKQELLNKKIILCKSIRDNSSILKDMGFDEAKIFKVMDEINAILHNG